MTGIENTSWSDNPNPPPKNDWKQSLQNQTQESLLEPQYSFVVEFIQVGSGVQVGVVNTRIMWDLTPQIDLYGILVHGKYLFKDIYRYCNPKQVSLITGRYDLKHNKPKTIDLMMGLSHSVIHGTKEYGPIHRIYTCVYGTRQDMVYLNYYTKCGQEIGNGLSVDLPKFNQWTNFDFKPVMFKNTKHSFDVTGTTCKECDAAEQVTTHLLQEFKTAPMAFTTGRALHDRNYYVRGDEMLSEKDYKKLNCITCYEYYKDEKTLRFSQALKSEVPT